jgi:hypothetical protein
MDTASHQVARGAPACLGQGPCVSLHMVSSAFLPLPSPRASHCQCDPVAYALPLGRSFLGCLSLQRVSTVPITVVQRGPSFRKVSRSLPRLIVPPPLRMSMIQPCLSRQSYMDLSNLAGLHGRRPVRQAKHLWLLKLACASKQLSAGGDVVRRPTVEQPCCLYWLTG